MTRIETYANSDLNASVINYIIGKYRHKNKTSQNKFKYLLADKAKLLQTKFLQIHLSFLTKSSTSRSSTFQTTKPFVL